MSHPFATDFVVNARACGRAISCPSLPFAHVFTTNDVNAGGEPEATGRAWAEIGRTLGLDVPRLVRARQVHGADAYVARAGTALPAAPPGADIVVSNDVSLAVTVRVADCVPLLLGDPSLGVVAAAHAGWRGTAARVAGVAVECLAEEFGSRPGNLVAAIGPCIGPEAYEVGESVRAAFRAADHDAVSVDRWFLPRDHQRLHLDLWRANIDQLVEAGVRASNIHCLRGCTWSHPQWFHSHRRDADRAGRMVAAIRPGSL
jgi:hypothetical protein